MRNMLKGLVFGAAMLASSMAMAQGINNFQYLKAVTVALTPAATAAAIATTEQVFATFIGLSVGDQIILNGPAPTALCPPVTARVSAANTVAIGFGTMTAAACTPAAGNYTVYALKSN